MRKIKKILLTASLMLVAGASAVAAASCDKKDSVKIAFNTNGGENIASVTLGKGEAYDLPTPAEREGFSFEGWYTSADFTGSPVTSVVAEKGVTYYAKWVEAYEIKLELDGGNFAKTSVYLKAGANIYDYMQTFDAPTKSGLTFGAWFDGENELSKNKRMTSDGITLTAKYKVDYTVQLMTEKLDGEGYESVLEPLTGSDYVGKETTVSHTMTGFTAVATSDAVSKLQLSAKAADNVFKLYFDRVSFDVVFDANYPDGSASDNAPISVKYGAEIEVPNDYVFEGHCLIGWSTSRTATTPDYKANYIQTALYKKGNAAVEPSDKFSPTRTTTLYAVWNKGYSDMFGNNDYVYILDEDSGVAYLSRGNVFFEGEFNKRSNSFTFIDGNEDIRMGFLRDNKTFVYSDQGRAGTSTLFEVGTGLVEGERVYFGATDTIEYFSEQEDGKDATSTGTYVIDENGYYVATFTDGELKGKTLTLIVGTVGEDKTPAFQIRNDDDIAFGKLRKIATNGSAFEIYNLYQIEMGGFGVATYTTDLKGSTASYYYTRDAEKNVITLTDANGNVFKTVKVVQEGNKNYYVDYEANYDRSFELADGSKLTLDGGYKAVYENAGSSLEGYFSWENSVFGGKVVTIEKASATYKFLIKETKVPGTGENDENTQDELVYTAEKKLAGYAEYRYTNKNGAYDAPLLTLNDPEENKATVYGRTADGELIAVYVGSFGEYDYNGKTLYVFGDAVKVSEVDVMADVVDLTKVKSFVFDVSDKAASYNVSFWYSSTNPDDVTTTYDVTYTGSKESETLTIVGGIAIYSYAGTLITGTYSTADGVTTVTNADGENVYLEINETAKTFVSLKEKPSTAVRYSEAGMVDRTVKMLHDGNGGATYQTLSLTDDGSETVDTEYKGTVTDTNKTTASGAPIKKFTSTEKTFDFIELFAGSERYFAMYSETVNGIYESATYGILDLDGFSWQGSYTDMDGVVYEGRYVIDKNGVICLSTDDEEMFFDVASDKTFTMRGGEYNTYMLFENQTFSEIYFEFDGRNKLVVYKFEKDGDESVRVDIDVNGTYEKDGDVYTLTYTDGGKTVTLIGELGLYKAGDASYHSFVPSNKSVMMTYVNPLDWSILVLDDVGNATKYSNTGKKDTGTYTLITNELLYYVNAAQTDACLYKYNVTNATASLIKLTPRGYYTSELEALYFTQYGFVTSGSERYYYNMEGNDVIIYRPFKDGDTQTPNDFGFVTENFGAFDTVKEYNGKTYYQNNKQFITFHRVEETKTQFPVEVSGRGSVLLQQLMFKPSGDYEFNVDGSVVLGDASNTEISCKVVRTVEDGVEKMYLAMNAGAGQFRFDIKFTYNGNNGMSEEGDPNTYEITGMSWICNAPSYIYLNTYYQIYAFYGANQASSYENTFGSIKMVRTYKADGTEEDFRLVGDFGESAKLFDYNGTALETLDETLTEKDGTYTAEFEGADGHTYRMHIDLRVHKAFGLYGFIVRSYTRVQTFTSNGYEVEVERILASDYLGFDDGNIYNVTVKNGETTVDPETVLTYGNTVYVIDRNYDDVGRVTGATYYKVALTEETVSTGDGEQTKIALFTGATVTMEVAETKHTADGLSYVDVGETSGVLLISLEGSSYVATKCSYDETTKTYTVETSSSKKFTVQVTETGSVTIAEVTENA